MENRLVWIPFVLSGNVCTLFIVFSKRAYFFLIYIAESLLDTVLKYTEIKVFINTLINT